MKMKGLLVFCLCFQAISAVLHSWKAFYTASTGLNEFPEFVALNLLDDELMGYFDSRTNRFESKQSWMENLGQEYVEQETNILRGNSQTFRANVRIVMERFNQSKGAHLVQWMYGCDWDDETDEVNGYDQRGYDGEDFISFDLKTETWVAPTPQAVITKHKWDNDKALIARYKNYHTQYCPEWLKKYVNYGRSSLMRKELPSVSVLQKTPSSPVTCHATGFYPDGADLFWRKDGVEIHEDVDKGEILPNHDGTFQMSVDLELSSVAAEDWKKYDCVFQLSGVKDDKVTKLDKNTIVTNWGRNDDDGGFPTAAVIGGVVGALLVLIIFIVGFTLWRRNKGFESASISDTSSDSDLKNVACEEQQMIKTKA